MPGMGCEAGDVEDEMRGMECGELDARDGMPAIRRRG